MTLPVVILAGGKASRLGALAKETPKAMQIVNGAPFIIHQLELLRQRGLTDITVCIGHLGSKIESFLGDGAALRGIKVTYADDGMTPKGTGGAVRWVLPLESSTFFVLYGDVLVDFDPQAFVDRRQEHDALGVMGVTSQTSEICNVATAHGRVLRYDKERWSGDMTAIDAGISLFHTSAFSEFPKGLTFDLGRVFQRLIERKALAALTMPGHVYQIGTPDGLQELRAKTERS